MVYCGVLRPFSFNTDLIDLLYKCRDCNIASYAEGTSPNLCTTDEHCITVELLVTITEFSISVGVCIVI